MKLNQELKQMPLEYTKRRLRIQSEVAPGAESVFKQIISLHPRFFLLSSFKKDCLSQFKV